MGAPVQAKHIGILGGSFDPIHFGHLRTALELVELVAMDALLLVPCGQPPHKTRLHASAADRLHMVQLAVAGDSCLSVDSRESKRPGPSYTVETLETLRQQYGEGTALSLCVGVDAFVQLASWHRWQEIIALAHIVVTARPGWQVPQHLGELECWRDRIVESPAGLRDANCGKLCFVSLTPVDISATGIRQRVSDGRSPRYLVPDTVWQYIDQQGLYREPAPLQTMQEK